MTRRIICACREYNLKTVQMKNIKIIPILILISLISTSFTNNIFAKGNNTSSQYIQGEVIEILEERENLDSETKERQIYQKVKVLITHGDKKNKEVISENNKKEVKNTNKYKVGDTIQISKSTDKQGNEIYSIVDYTRTKGLGILFLLFITLSVLIGTRNGFFSLISMVLSFIIIFLFLLPQIEKGRDPILIAIISSMLIIPIIFYISHGFNKKATIAIVGTVIALIITGILSVIFSDLSYLTGSTSEEILLLQGANNITYNLRGLLLAGILIGTLGIMDDITIAQTSIVYQLYDLKNDISIPELFKRSLQLGRDHIASMINTLVLVYTGASMPLLLLFVNESRNFSEVISLEIVATEIVKTLVGSIGLILAVPITTCLACYCVKNQKKY